MNREQTRHQKRKVHSNCYCKKYASPMHRLKAFNRLSFPALKFLKHEMSLQVIRRLVNKAWFTKVVTLISHGKLNRGGYTPENRFKVS